MVRARRFYVAGKATDAEDHVRTVAGHLIDRGWDWAMDWTTVAVDKPYLDHVRTNGATAEQMKAAATDADLVVYVPGPDVFGALIEVGIAIGAGATVAVLGESRQSIFWCLDQVHVVADLGDLDRLAAGIEAVAAPLYVAAGAIDTNSWYVFDRTAPDPTTHTGHLRIAGPFESKANAERRCQHSAARHLELAHYAAPTGAQIAAHLRAGGQVEQWGASTASWRPLPAGHIRSWVDRAGSARQPGYRLVPA